MALDNARAWLSDADLLALRGGHPGHALGLMLLALEETAKAFLWTMVPTLEDPQERGSVRARAASDHDYRLAVGWSLIAAYRESRRTLASLCGAAEGQPGMLEYLQARLRAVEAHPPQHRFRTLAFRLRTAPLYVDWHDKEFTTPMSAAPGDAKASEAILDDVRGAWALASRFHTAVVTADRQERRRLGSIWKQASSVAQGLLKGTASTEHP